jgi:hypothetical protein
MTSPVSVCSILLLLIAECTGICGFCPRYDPQCHEGSLGLENFIAKMDFAVPLAGGTRVADASGNLALNGLDSNLASNPPVL